jgi:glycosyl transferase, family 25
MVAPHSRSIAIPQHERDDTMTTRNQDLTLLQHVPHVQIPSNGDFKQAAGVDLPIAVINLPHRPDRWEALSKRMTAVGLNKLIRVPAVYGAELSAQQVSNFLHAPATNIEDAPRSHLTLTRPAIGCFMSHLAVWRWAIEANLPRVLVFEDDALPGKNFDAAHFHALLTSLPNDAGLVFLGSVIMNGMADRASNGSNLARLYYFNGTFAYLITPAACRTLIAALNPPHWHIDHQISQVLFDKRESFHAYRTEPYAFEADWNLRSDCYVPLAEETDADKVLGDILNTRRQQLLAEGRPLLPPHV